MNEYAADRQTDRQTDRQAGRQQANRQTDRWSFTSSMSMHVFMLYILTIAQLRGPFDAKDAHS